jgi:hypothetical protein
VITSENGRKADTYREFSEGDSVISLIAPNPPAFITTEEGLAEAVEDLRGADWVALDLEGDLAVHAGREGVRVISIYAGGYKVHRVDCYAVDPAPLRDVLRDPDIYVHGKEYDLPTLMVNFGFEFQGQVFDTLNASRCAYPGSYVWRADLDGESVFDEVHHSLVDAVRRELPGAEFSTYDKTKAKFQKPPAWIGTAKEGPPELTEEHARYAGEDVLHLKDLHDALLDRMRGF